ncbi:hypothetical protein M422DRAFT_64162 [Sphaerobolus stellatus SS14]|nr:hypothetical protein M422DRAFT_64162 [Sphaerobolus stellatus SS14]
MEDYLCVLTAISPNPGPTALVDTDQELDQGTYIMISELDDVSQAMASEIYEALNGQIRLDELEQTMKQGLRCAEETDESWWPEGMLDESYFGTAVLIGPGESAEIELLRVKDYDWVTRCWTTAFVSSREETMPSTLRMKHWGNKGQRFFAWERPYLYLKTWLQEHYRIDRNKCFYKTFFQVVDRSRSLGGYGPGLVNGISYGGLEDAFNYDDLTMYSLAGARKTSKATLKAVMAGKEGKELWPAFAEDFGAWMLVRPDIWPNSVKGRKSISAGTPMIGSEGVFSLLPTELRLRLLFYMPLSSLMALSETCRLMYILWDSNADQIIKQKVYSGDLHWVLPVSAVVGEAEAAKNTVASWFTPTNRLEDLFESPDFPWYPFLLACLRSNSMRNRRRIWNISEQFRKLWNAG